MSGPLYQMPVHWAPRDCWVPLSILNAWQRSYTDDDEDLPPPSPTDECCYSSYARCPWYNGIAELAFYSAEKEETDEDILELLGLILSQALCLEKDCARILQPEERHHLCFFTNYRVIQVYCVHCIPESRTFKSLRAANIKYCGLQPTTRAKRLNYESLTKHAFTAARPFLAWECLFPIDLDMEALSPLDANINLKNKHVQKVKAPPAKALSREKDHPPPPPQEILEPPSSDRLNGAIYKTGRLLGKGGFAICYEAQLAGTKRRYALKIVKSHMPLKKMEQKFQTELQIHSKMKHPNIVQFHRAFTFQQCTYIVLELCPNGSLMDMVKKRRFLTEPEVRFYTVQIVGAVKYMHAKGIIHRDLKMGNIFLDKDMNIKVGDFGLAALLMSGKDMTAVRRTTLCGTPNYIAPEILEKGKKGHDHAVDIWSIGIIIFAMLTGRPPFQSTTQDEIYRRAKLREYDWPRLDSSENYICQEAKELVANLLQDADDRPTPDTIVQHDFFSCGWVPQAEEMSPNFREVPPNPDHFLSVGLRGGRANLYNSNLQKLCLKSNVGPLCLDQKPPPSTYREVALEERAGLTPAVPLPENVVYRPYDDWLRENPKHPREEVRVNEKESAEEVVFVSQSTRLPPAANRNVPQSFAAQQRAQNQPTTISTSSRTKDPQADMEQLVSTQRKAKIPALEALKGRTAMSLPTRGIKIKSNSQEERIAEPPSSIDIEARLGADLVQQLNQARAERKSQEEPYMTPSASQASTFGPRENPEQLQGTKPDEILQRLQTLQAELERVLNSRSPGPLRDSPSKNATIVVKWVDYTNKFGLGYILSNGSVGCIFKTLPAHNDAQGRFIPPTCVLVRNAERHLQNRQNKNYPDRDQLVPVSGSRIEFFENHGHDGISRVKVNPRNFAVTAGPNGEPGKLSRGKDEFDDRKREKIVLWKKFANYMTAYGRDQDYPYDETLQKSPQSSSSPSADVVTFYQRFGDVGCWAFCDGHFQFNFPDHTKIVISADGTWCDFYHLPLEAARDLAATGTLSASALDDRQHLSYPLQTLLNFIAKPSRTGKASTRSLNRPQIDPMIQGIPQANDFRRKIDFIKTIVSEWVVHGGLGNSDMEPQGRLRWMGHRENVNVKIPYKHVWVTVGARAGDDRRVAWFDPRKPHEVIPDIES